MGKLGEVASLLFWRLAIGAICGFVVLMIVSWTLMYFAALPDEPEATTYATVLFFGVAFSVAAIGLRAAKAALLLAPIFLACTAIVLGVVQAQAVIAQPDLNSDGVFTIRDFLHGIALSVFAVGEEYGEIMFGPVDAQTPFVRFFEISPWVALWAVRIGFTALVWFFAIGWVALIINFEPPKPDEGE